MKQSRSAKRELVEAGAALAQRGYLVADLGLLSVRAGAEIYFAPTGADRGQLDPKALDEVRLDGKGKRSVPPNSDAWTHLVIYRERSEVGAIIHAQPPAATAFTTSGTRLEPQLLPDVLTRLGGVPLIRRDASLVADSTTTSLLEHLDQAKVFLLANRGVVAVGTSPQEAVARLELVEHCAQVQLRAHLLGGAEPLPEQAVRRLVEAHFEAKGGRNL